MKTFLTALAFGIAGALLGALVLIVLSLVLDWEVQRLGPVATYLVVAFVAGFPVLFVTGLVLGLRQFRGLPAGRLALLAAIVAAVLGAVWGIAGAQSHLDASLGEVMLEVAGGCTVAAAICALGLAAIRRGNGAGSRVTAP